MAYLSCGPKLFRFDRLVDSEGRAPCVDITISPEPKRREESSVHVSLRLDFERGALDHLFVQGIRIGNLGTYGLPSVLHALCEAFRELPEVKKKTIAYCFDPDWTSYAEASCVSRARRLGPGHYSGEASDLVERFARHFCECLEQEEALMEALLTSKKT